MIHHRDTEIAEVALRRTIGRLSALTYADGGYPTLRTIHQTGSPATANTIKESGTQNEAPISFLLSAIILLAQTTVLPGATKATKRWYAALRSSRASPPESRRF